MNYSQRVKKLYTVKHLLGEFLPVGRRVSELRRLTKTKFHQRSYGQLPCDICRPRTYPDKFKVKLENRESAELGRLYDFLFSDLHCGWAGRTGHYAYVEVGEESQLAANQDGYLYVFKHIDVRLVTADSSYGSSAFIEIARPDSVSCPKCSGSGYIDKFYLRRHPAKRRRLKRVSRPCSFCGGTRWTIDEIGDRRFCYCGDGRVYY